MGFSNDNLGASASNNEHLLFNLPPVEEKRVEVSFTAPDVSMNGGLLLFKECERQSGIIKSVLSCIKDERDSSYVQHSHQSMLTQRVFQIMAGYEDGNDCNRLRGDDILKVCSGRLPSDNDLASQPTMSRFENGLTYRELYKIAHTFADHFMDSFPEEPPVIILDADDTNFDVYGGQQGSLFNDYYGEYCFMPLLIFDGVSGKLITSILKPGRRSKNIDVFAIMSRLVTKIRQRWKKTMIVIRGDGHFCSHQLMDWCLEKDDNVHFITGLAGNSALNKLAECTVKATENQFAQTKRAAKMYHSFDYKAGSWKHAQRVIVKVEVNSMGKNIRYIVTDLRQWRTQQLYEKGYCARGGMELLIKEHKTYLQSDRMSCANFGANQFRLFMHSIAYVLMHTLKTEILHVTEYATATFKTIREHLIKVAAYVKEMKTKIKIEFPASCPQAAVFSRCFQIFGELKI